MIQPYGYWQGETKRNSALSLSSIPLAMNSLRCALLSFVIICTSFTTVDTASLLEWSPARKLNWNDFRGTPAQQSYASAQTVVTISAKPSMTRGHKPNYIVRAYFDPDKSWCKTKSPRLLAHEQLHFDIAQVYVMRIQRAIASYQSAGIKDYKEYHKMIRQLMEESNEADRQYDRETLHGVKLTEQIAWELTIKEELATYNASAIVSN